MKNLKELGYNAEEEKYLLDTMRILAFVGAYCNITTDEELKAWCDKKLAEKAEREAKEKEKAERKANKEKENAEALGLTVEEYKRYKKDKAIARKLPKEIEECRAEIENLKKAIARKEKYLAELNAKIAKIEEA
jgi:hypothetical protein